MLCCTQALWPRCWKSKPPLAAAAYVMARGKVLGYPNLVRNTVWLFSALCGGCG